MIYGLTSNHLSDPILWAVAQYSVTYIYQLHTNNDDGSYPIDLSRFKLIRKLKLRSTAADIITILKYKNGSYYDMLAYLMPRLRDPYRMNMLIRYIRDMGDISDVPSIMFRPIVDYCIHKNILEQTSRMIMGDIIIYIIERGPLSIPKELLRYYVVTGDAFYTSRSGVLIGNGMNESYSRWALRNGINKMQFPEDVLKVFDKMTIITYDAPTDRFHYYAYSHTPLIHG